MKIATFNVNGIKARIDTVLGWLETSAPDVAVLQEIKSVDEGFPRVLFERLGYRVETHGQKGFNGVAILSKLPLEDVTVRLPGDGEDSHARWIEGSVIGTRAVRVCGLYLPNGNPAPGPKYDYKLAWMERLRLRAAELLAGEEPVVMLGDYNVIPQREDAARPDAWMNDALFLPESRAAFRRLIHLGFTDALLVRSPAPGFTFWDYQAGAWERNNGIRIDHVLLSPQAADMLVEAGIEKEMRAGDKPSDHVPVWVELAA
jgi:exodeoxyribonuclease-3